MTKAKIYESNTKIDNKMKPVISGLHPSLCTNLALLLFCRQLQGALLNDNYIQQYVQV